MRFVLWLLQSLTSKRRMPDQVIRRSNGLPYLLRWWVFGKSKELDKHGEPKPRRPFGLSVYVHCFVRSDDDRANHDHPWDWCSLLLANDYIEHTGNSFAWPPEVQVEHYRAGSLRFGRAEGLHRVQLFPGEQVVWLKDGSGLATNETPVWTLFITGKWRRDWGFMCKHGWVWWRDYDSRGGCE